MDYEGRCRYQAAASDFETVCSRVCTCVPSLLQANACPAFISLYKASPELVDVKHMPGLGSRQKQWVDFLLFIARP